MLPVIKCSRLYKVVDRLVNEFLNKPSVVLMCTLNFASILLIFTYRPQMEVTCNFNDNKLFTLQHGTCNYKSNDVNMFALSIGSYRHDKS